MELDLFGEEVRKNARCRALVLTKSMQLEIHEVKGGFWTDDALVKIKTAAERFPFKFISVQLIKGEWITREF